jgi:hypothetical protein
MFTEATALYCIIALIVSAAMHLVEKKSRIAGMASVEAN